MKKSFCPYFLFFCFTLILLSSCDKGYQVRFSNYYTEAMDSVVVGQNKLIFQNIAQETKTGFNTITKGNYTIRCISKTKKVFYSTITIPKSGTGSRTIQIDGVNQISILEE